MSVYDVSSGKRTISSPLPRFIRSVQIQTSLAVYSPNNPTAIHPPTNQNPRENHQAQLSGRARSTRAIMLPNATAVPPQLLMK